MLNTNLCRPLLPATLLSLVFGGSVLSDEPPGHEQQTQSAWTAFKEGKYEKAIADADACISQFREAAKRQQKELDQVKATIGNGRVTDKEKEAIQKNGVLNDVATCLYIRGRSMDKLGDKEKACRFLRDALTYPGARSWDSKGWFWSPAEAAELFLRDPQLADRTPHEVYATDAWAAFNKAEHAKAIEAAERCIKEFDATAKESEKVVAKSGQAIPTGPVDEATKQRIFSNGALNDVATCLYIKGQAAEALGDKTKATDAYRRAAELIHGRCWDPQGWFWSPAKQARERLAVLN
jgi:tetratricopeptide (TPR) repeat protein